MNLALPVMFVLAAPDAVPVEPLDIASPCVELPDLPPSATARALPLRLVWADVLGLARPAYEGMASEAAAVLGQAGVQVSWRRAGRRTLADGDEVVVVLLPRPAPGRERVMGAIQRHSTHARAVWIYFHNVAWAVGQDASQAANWTPSEWMPAGRALGRVVAHEVLHLLLPDAEHAASGLMRAELNRSTLLDPGVRLDEAFRLALRGRLRRDLGREPPPAAPAAGRLRARVRRQRAPRPLVPSLRLPDALEGLRQ